MASTVNFQDAPGTLCELLAQGSAGSSITKRRLQGGLHGNMEVIEVDNGRMRFWVLPERGMGIWKVWLDGVELGWQSPVRGPVHPYYVPLHDPSGLGWLDGFDELLCRCGLESNGAAEFDALGRLRYPLHGKIANQPAYDVQAGIDEQLALTSVRGNVDEARFKFRKLQLATTVSCVAGSSELLISDTVTNRSAVASDFQLLYHINFGSPLLEAGAQVVAPVAMLSPRTAVAEQGVASWSRYAAPVAGYEEQVYFMQLLGDANSQTEVLLKNKAGDKGVSLHFDLHQLPCFTLWKNTAAECDGYVTGLEPGTNYPNPHSYEQKQGRVMTLQPGESRRFDIRIAFHRDAASVQQAEQRIAILQAAQAAIIHPTMQRGWSIEADR